MEKPDLKHGHGYYTREPKKPKDYTNDEWAKFDLNNNITKERRLEIEKLKVRITQQKQKEKLEHQKQAEIQQKEQSTLLWKIVHLHHISDAQRKKLYPEMKKDILELKKIRKLLIEDINSDQPKTFKHQPIGWYDSDRRMLLNELNAIIGDR